MGSRLANNISRYLEEGPGTHSGPLDGARLQTGALPWLRRLPSRFQAEMEGLAEGAGVTLQTVAAWSFVEACTAGGCSAFVGRTGGQTWVARNNDIWVPDLWGYVTIRDLEGYIPTMAFGLEGETFTATGLNAERLWLHYNYLPVWDAPQGKEPWMPFVLLTRAMETCRTIDQVEALLRATERNGGMMIFAADGKNGEYAVFECSCRHHVRRRGQGDWLAGTNHYLARDVPRPAEAYAAASLARYRRLAARLERDMGDGAPADLAAILADAGIEQRGADYGTVYANVTCPTSGEVWFTLGGYPAASAGAWQRLAWPWP
jgi:hypothetical protein